MPTANSRNRFDKKTHLNRAITLKTCSFTAVKDGWLFGKADLIAFETMNSFVFVQRRDRLTVVNQKLDLAVKVKSAKEALYKIYTRNGRKDKLTLLPIRDIEPIVFMKWKR